MWCIEMLAMLLVPLGPVSQHPPSWLTSCRMLRSADSAARLSQKQGAGGQLAAASWIQFHWYAGTADLSVEALPVKLWQGKLNVEPLQRKSKWTAATAHIASDNNCLAARSASAQTAFEASRRASQYQAGDLRTATGYLSELGRAGCASRGRISPRPR